MKKIGDPKSREFFSDFLDKVGLAFQKQVGDRIIISKAAEDQKREICLAMLDAYQVLNGDKRKLDCPTTQDHGRLPQEPPRSRGRVGH